MSCNCPQHTTRHDPLSALQLLLKRYRDAALDYRILRAERGLWAQARTFPEIGGLTARWLEGGMSHHPGYCGQPDKETTEILKPLIHANVRGFVTIGSQPGVDPVRGYDGHLWHQRAAVDGFINYGTLMVLRQLTEGTRLIVEVHPTTRKRRNDYSHIHPVTGYVDGSWNGTHFGCVLSRREIEFEFGETHPDGVWSLIMADQVTIVDPWWGDHSLLWEVLGAL